MKNEINFNSFPDNYVEENLPAIMVEIRYKRNNKFNRKRVVGIARKIKKFLDNMEE